MKHVGYQNRIQAYQCGISPNTKILGFLVLLVYAFASAVAGSVGGIALIWGKPSRDGSGGIVVVAFSQCYSVFCLLDYIVSGVAAHSVVTSSPRFSGARPGVHLGPEPYVCGVSILFFGVH